jgi:4'-phosphopantetheinyl transferase
MSSPNSSDFRWPPAPATPFRPAADEVVVWRVALADVQTQDLSILSADEIERADRFKFADVRLSFIQARLFLRRMLGAILKQPPADLRFTFEGNGKPKLVDETIAFNLSHSGGEALLAVSTASPIGVDLEQIRAERDLIGLARRYFAAAEIEELLQLDPSDQVRGFYSCWTRKEAFIKAIGEGLSHPLDSFAVNLTPGEAPIFKAPQTDWKIFNLELGEQFAGAVVVPKTVVRLSCFQLESL